MKADNPTSFIGQSPIKDVGHLPHQYIQSSLNPSFEKEGLVADQGLRANAQQQKDVGRREPLVVSWELLVVSL